MFAYLPAEEKANTWTHLVAFVCSLLVAVPLTALALSDGNGWREMLGTALFILGSLLMYGSSTLYHAAAEPDAKRRLRVLDHVSIYAMIAGSYSLICISVVGGWAGWTLFGFLWACVIAGVAGKLIALGKHPGLSLVLYLVMGWVALLILVPMWRNMPRAAFWWVLAEGVFYTVGTYFFRLDEEHPFYHAVWHVFIILGSASHTIATALILAA
ncbi:MAG: hemolysin III family protein [Paludibacteraceae bacterium]|nr:hemolysin III family protein [Paludibacteraceae bacterium]